jgi:translocation protein SEC62
VWTILGGVGMVAVMLAGVMFPLWPVKLRVGVWYLSVGALGLVGAFIVLAIIRLIFWCLTVLCAKRAIWIFPNLFEDVGFVSDIRPISRLARLH